MVWNNLIDIKEGLIQHLLSHGHCDGWIMTDELLEKFELAIRDDEKHGRKTNGKNKSSKEG